MSDGGAKCPEPPTSYVNFHCGDIELGEQAPNQESLGPIAVTVESQPVPFHTLILDLAGVCFIDLMGIKVLTKVLNFGLFATLFDLWDFIFHLISHATWTVFYKNHPLTAAFPHTDELQLRDAGH